MADVTVPTAPALVTLPNIELMHTGQWDISTGTFTFTSDDFYSAVAALECPAVHNPHLKLGHLEPPLTDSKIRWDGEPALGWIGNMAVAEAGRMLVGDYIGLPGWLAAADENGNRVITSAYPQRSVEGEYDHRCQLGHVHPFVITAVALLGTTPPGIGTIQSLQDVAALYGVAASTDARPSGTPFTLTIAAAAREDRVPNPRSNEVAAGVTTEDVRRSFYTSDYGKSWDIWVEEMQLGPELQLIVCDDATGKRSRVPVVIGDGDGEAAVSFGDPVEVVIRYEDATAAVAASAGLPVPVRYATRAESRPGERPAVASTDTDPETPSVPAATEPQPEPDPAPAVDVEPEPQDPADPADPSPTTTEGAGMDIDPAKIREVLGLLPEASDEEVGAAIAAAGLVPQPEPTPEPEPVAPVAPALPEGVTTIDEAALADLLEKANQGVAARAQQLADVRARTLDDAVKAGKIPPARRDHYGQMYDLDPEGTRQALASLAPGLVPLADAGEPGGAEATSEDAAFAEFDRFFTRPAAAGKGV